MKIVNCKIELDLFEALLTCKTDKRILAIKSTSGSGKTTLLEKLEHICLSSNTPVARIDLDQANVLTPLDVIKNIVQELSISDVNLPNFEDAYDSYLAKNFSEILNIKRKLSSNHVIRLSNASDLQKTGDYINLNFRDARFDYSSGLTIVGQQLRFNNISEQDMKNMLTTVTQNGKLTDEQDERSKAICIQAFFHDLHVHRRRRRQGRYINKLPLVLLFDTYEKTGDSIRNWFDNILKQYFIDLENRPRNLLAVICGQEVPDFDKITNTDTQNHSIISLDYLSQWSDEDIETAAKLKNVTEIEDAMKQIYKASPNMTPIKILQMMDIVASAGKRAKA